MKRKIWNALPILLLSAGVFLTACGKEPVNAGSAAVESSVSAAEDSKESRTAVESNGTAENGNEEENSSTGTEKTDIPSFEFASAGPSYVYGVGSCERYFWAYNEMEPAYLGTCEFVYLATPGYDKLQKKLNEYNSRILNERAENDDWVAELIQEEAESLEAAGITETGDYDSYYFPWNFDVQSYVVRSDSKVFSLIAGYDTYLGGAHPSGYEFGYNFDTQSGEELTLKDVVKNTEDLKAIVIEKLGENPYADESFYDEWKEIVADEFAADAVNWCFDTSGLIIWFNSYEIAPYVTGPVDLEISYAEYPELFRTEYLGADTDDYDTGRMETDLTENVSGLYRDVVMKLYDKLGKISLSEMGDLVKDLGYVYEYQEPEIEVSDGEIKLYDKDSEDYLYLFCWPDEDGTPLLYDMWYDRGDYRAIITDFAFEGNTKYQMVYDSLYEAVQFDNFEDVTAAIFLGVE